MTYEWTQDQLGRNPKTQKWFCYPTLPGLDVIIFIEGEDPGEVIYTANWIERGKGR